MLHKIVEHAALDGGGVFNANHHLGENIFINTRRREVIGGADFAEALHHGIGRFGAVEAKPGHTGLRIGIQEIADPGHRQIAEDIVGVRNAIEFNQYLGRVDEGGVGVRYALGLTGGARGIEHDGNIVWPTGGDFGFKMAGMLLVKFAAPGEQIGVGFHRGLGVISQPTRVIKNEMRELRALRTDFQELVDLLLILNHRETHLCILQHVHHFLRDGVLIQRHGNPAQTFCCHHRPVEARAIVADHGQRIATFEAERRKATGEGTHFFLYFGPGIGLPDA